MNRIFRLFGLIVLAFGLMIGGAIANAADRQGATVSPLTADDASDQASAAGCPSGSYSFQTPWGLGGCAACQDGCAIDVFWNDGHEEDFAIGSDHQVYRALNGAQHWTSMGGWAKDSISAYYWHDTYATIDVIGRDSRHWCSSWTGSSWQSWHRCEGS
ncbi:MULTISPECIES: hypothetical protein [unclassified Nocardia]|uniref:hypothetical protein n=1 Tax=unclassified Nocardia TaxID=2637762 RepID=UPI001CE3E34F|nr:MULTISPECIES: hypothetical protein [unclassified Nocardia]